MYIDNVFLDFVSQELEIDFIDVEVLKIRLEGRVLHFQFRVTGEEEEILTYNLRFADRNQMNKRLKIYLRKIIPDGASALMTVDGIKYPDGRVITSIYYSNVDRTLEVEYENKDLKIKGKVTQVFN